MDLPSSSLGTSTLSGGTICCPVTLLDVPVTRRIFQDYLDSLRELDEVV